MIRIPNRHDPRFYDSRLHFGGSSESQANSTSQQYYYDQRQAIQNDQHNTNYSSSSNYSSNQAYSDNHAYTSTVADSGNTSNSGNSFTQWLSSVTSSLSNSGNTTSNTSNSTAFTDGRSSTTNWTDSSTSNVTDSRNYATNTSNSGNSSSVINWTGTDAGAVQLATTQAQLLGAMSAGQIDGLKTLSTFGDHAIGGAYELANQTAANSMIASSHMLDLTGELIDRLATGTSGALAAQAQISGAAVAQSQAITSSADASSKRLMLIGGAVLVALVLLKK